MWWRARNKQRAALLHPCSSMTARSSAMSWARGVDMTAVVVLYPVVIPSLGHDPGADEHCDAAFPHGEDAWLKATALVKE